MDFQFISNYSLYFRENVTVFLAALVLLYFGRKLLRRLRFIDRPISRSSHYKPTTTAGGLIFIPIIIIGWLLFAGGKGHNIELVSLIVLVVGIVSVVDDMFDLHGGGRLVVHIVVCFCLIYYIPLSGALPFIGNGILQSIVTLIMFVWFVNLYNFMDGIDGVAASGAVIMSLGLYVVGESVGWQYSMEASIVMSVMIAFSLFNLPPAKLFMGDVGAISLGLILGYLFIRLAQSGYLASALILPMYFVFDTTMVLLIRLGRGLSPFATHRTFSFHHAFDAGMPQKTIVFYISVMNLILIGMAYWAISQPMLAFVLSFIPVSLLWWYLRKTKLGIAN